MRRPDPPPVVAVVAFDRISPFHLSVPCVVFGESHPGAPVWDVRVCAVEAGSLRTSAGFNVTVTHGLEALRRANIVIVPSWREPAESPPMQLLRGLNAAHRRGATVVGLCLGSYVLGAAGLLNGRRATTHWAYAADFAERFPKVRVDANVLYIDEGDVLTSAGTAAGIDCCLHLLRQRHGVRTANSVARRLVIAPHRQGGQAQFIEQPLVLEGRDMRLTALLKGVRAELHEQHTLDSLAARASMSRRTFTRHFQKHTGETVHGWLVRERLALAQQLLESTDETIEQISQRAGFGSAVSLREHFRATFQVSPSQWRQTFMGLGRSRAGGHQDSGRDREHLR